MIKHKFDHVDFLFIEKQLKDLFYLFFGKATRNIDRIFEFLIKFLKHFLKQLKFFLKVLKT